MARLVRAGVITRIRQGAYAAFGVWAASDDVGRHRLLAEAVLMQYDDDVAVSHDTAAIRHDGPNYGLDLSKVHLTHLTSQSGRRNVAGIVHHEGSIRVLDLTDWGSTGQRRPRAPFSTWRCCTESKLASS